MKTTLKRYIALFTFILISSYAFSQVTTTIRGKVVDEKGAPLFGVTVYLNNNQGASTLENGTYEIKNVVPGSYNMTASYIGFASQTNY